MHSADNTAMKMVSTENGPGKRRAVRHRQGPAEEGTVEGASDRLFPLSESESLMEQASQRFEQLFQGLPISCFCYDVEGRIMEWNRGSETLFGRPAASAFLVSVWELVGRPEDAEILRAIIRSVIAGAAYEGIRVGTARAGRRPAQAPAVQRLPDARPDGGYRRRRHRLRGHFGAGAGGAGTLGE